MDVFHDYAYYYNSFYQDKDYKAEAAQVQQMLVKYGRNVSSLINFGCGTGRHDIEFHKLGYQCSGIDMSPVMIDMAKKNAEKESMDISFIEADIQDFCIRKHFDAVVSLFHVMSYQVKNEDIISAFQSARRVLNEHGLFIFDAWYGPGVLSDKPSVRVKEIEDEQNTLIRIAKPVMHDKENVVNVCYEVLVINKVTRETKAIHEVHNMRYFFCPELEYFLRETGFELIDVLDCKTLGITDYNSWTSYFIARAV